MVVRRPQLWLLDEPHAGLDQEGRDVVDALVAAASGAGATVLVASHELERARRITMRAVTLAGGIVHSDSFAAPLASDSAAAPLAQVAPVATKGGESVA